MLTTLNLALGPLAATCAWYSFSRALTRMASTAEESACEAWRLDEVRRQRLRRHSGVVRYAEPLVRDLIDSGVSRRIVNLDRVEKDLLLSGESTIWNATEFAAAAATQAVGVAFALVLVLCLLVGSTLPSLGLPIIVVVFFFRSIKSLQGRAKRRVAKLRRGLPYATDLLSLMMEAGAELTEALETAVETMAGSVVGEELHRVRRLIDRGESVEAALDQLQKHGDCEEVRDLVRAIKNARRLGAPLSQTMLLMAEQMRLKRVQRAEEQVGKAQVQITFPGILIMAACLLIVLAVFVLPALCGDSLF